MKDKKLRNLFPITSNAELEKINKRIEKLKRFLTNYYQVVENFIIPNYEDENAKLIGHLTFKIEIALESCIELLDLGFYGSANAIYRQIYEYIVWLKMHLSDTSGIVEETFFDLNKKDDAIKFLKEQFKIKLSDEYNTIINTTDITEFVKAYYAELCALTHGTCSSQQFFIPAEDSYDELQLSMIRLVTLLCMAIYTTQMAYCKYYQESNNLENNKSDILLLKNLHIDCEKFLSDLDNTKKDNEVPLQLIILKGKWQSLR